MAFPTNTTDAWFKVTIADALKKVTNALDWDGNTIKVALYTNSIATVDYDANVGYGAAPWNAAEVANDAATGYTTGGITLSAGKTVAVSPAGTLKLTSTTTPVWTTTSGTLTARGALVYDSTAAGAGTVGNGVVGWYFGASDKVASGGGTFTITINALGILTFT